MKLQMKIIEHYSDACGDAKNAGPENCNGLPD